MTYTAPRRHRSHSGSGWSLVLLSGVIGFGGCQTVQLDAPKEESYAFTEVADTPLGRLVEPMAASHPGLSGFRFYGDGIEGLAARQLLAKSAQRSIDAQYYLITDDMVGLLFLDSLLSAADRGVRVRLLVDDIQTQGYDAGIVALDSHPNFSVRIFNPFSGRRSRVADGLFDFRRINRRMHNKSFTADNQVAIIGGRNIADEYFSARPDLNFGDMDVMGVGPVARDVSVMFDRYWNSRWAAPAEVFARQPEDPGAALETLRARLAANRTEAATTVYKQVLDEDVARLAGLKAHQLDWTPYRLVYDSPDKADTAQEGPTHRIVSDLKAVTAKAHRELLVVSPYFVPQRSGVAFFQDLVDRGVKVTVVTNSLAANNHGIVHSGYIAYRKDLLRMGVELREVKINSEVSGVARGGSGATLATLHTKAFMVDREHVFLGSFNWDPRSAKLNTESGVVIESAAVGAEMYRQFEAYARVKTYRVRLVDDRHLEWVDEAGAEPVVFTKEPDVSWWRRTLASWGRLLPIHGQL